MFPWMLAIAKAYDDVCAVIPCACKIGIIFLAVLLNSCSRLLPSLVVDGLLAKVASVLSRFLRFHGL